MGRGPRGGKKNFSPARIDTRVLIARKTGLGKQLSENFGKETISESFRALLSVLSKLKTRFSEFVQKMNFFCVKIQLNSLFMRRLNFCA